MEVAGKVSWVRRADFWADESCPRTRRPLGMGIQCSVRWEL